MSQYNLTIGNESIKISKNDIDAYKKMFKYIISKNIGNLISNNELKKILSSITEKDLYYTYIFFYNFYLTYINNNDEKENLYLFNIEKGFNINKKIIILWYIFLFNLITNKKMILEKGIKKMMKMNQNIHLLKETNNILYKLYLSKKLSEEEIFLFIDFYIFWIEYYHNYSFINEKNRKIKNIILFKYLFSLVEKIVQEIKKNINKEKLDLLIKFMDDFKKSDEINNKYNIIILIKFNHIQSFIQNILNNIDITKATKINKNYQYILIKFYTHFIRFQFRLSSIFNIFLDNLRIAYEHLYNFQDNIEKIIYDLNIQNFQTKLLKKINESEEEMINKDEFPLLNDSFFFNGVDSLIAFKIDKFEYNHNCLFFSFNFNPNISKNNNSKIYPILVIQREILNDSKNFIYENLFVLYLDKINKKENDSELYSLLISQPLMKSNIFQHKEDKIIIRKNINYYCCLYFEEKRIKIYLYYDTINESNKIIKKNIKLNDLPKNNVVFSLGCDSLLYNKDLKEKDEKKNFFSGYIGPIFIIKNLSSKLRTNITLEQIIEKILLLKEGYVDIFYFKKRESTININNISNNFNTDFIDYSFNLVNRKNEKSINSLLKKHFNNFDCSLYLVPNCFIYYYNKNDANKIYHLPLVSNLCDFQKNYIIKKLNITLSKHNLSMPNFIYDNGFNYFCLQLEYFNQLAQYYLANKQLNNNIKDIFASDDKNNNLIKDIIYCIKINLLLLGNRGNEINLSKTYKQTFMTLFNLLKNLNKIKPIINDIIGDLISLSDIYKCNIFTNYYNLKDIINIEENIKKEIEKENENDKNNKKFKRKKLFAEEKIKELKEKSNITINKNCSFFVGIMEILLSKEFYMNNNIAEENYLLMKLTFEKVSSIMDIKDYDCLSFFSYPNLFNQALSFTNLLKDLMVSYMPDIKIINKKNYNVYSSFGGKNYIKGSTIEESNNVLISYFKLLNIVFRNKAINKSTSKEYFQKVFRFIFGNHRYDLPIVYNYLHMFYYFIAENYKFYMSYEEIMQIFDYLNEITRLKEEHIRKFINNKNEDEILKKDNKKEGDKNMKDFNKRKDKIKSVIICILIEILFSLKEIPDAINDLFNYINGKKISKNFFLLVIDEIDKYFHIMFNKYEESLLIKKNIKEISKYYLNLFNLLTSLLNSLLSDNVEYNLYEDDTKANNLLKEKDTQKLWCILSVINLLSDVSNEIETNLNKGIYKEETIYCVINYMIFLYNIIMDNKLNILYTHDLFFTTAENVFNHCNKLSLNNSNVLISLNNGEGNMKTIIELIFDIYIEYSINVCSNEEKKKYFKNNNNNIRLFAILKIQNYFVLENKNKKLKEKYKFNYNDFVSIFFINDYFKLISTNKKYIKNDLFYFNINDKINDLKELNNIIKVENKFNLIFLIFFMIKIEVYKEEISTKLKNERKVYNEYTIKMLNQLFNTLIYIQKVIIDDYKKLYILNKDYISKTSSEYPCYNTIRTSIESKIVNEIKSKIEDELFKEIIIDSNLKVINLLDNDLDIIKEGLSPSFVGKNKSWSKSCSRTYSVSDFGMNSLSMLKDEIVNNKENKLIEEPLSLKKRESSKNLINNNSLSNKNNIDEKEKDKNILDIINNENIDESEHIFNFIERDSTFIKYFLFIQK